jgi:hypothetical protein
LKGKIMPDFDNLNSFMNSDGAGGIKHVNGRMHGWSPSESATVPAGHQVLSGFYMNAGRQIATTILVESRLGFDATDAAFIVRWFMEDGTLHKSTKVTGSPLGYLGYLHDYFRNRLFAVTRIDDAGRVVAIPKIGKVNDGWHNFS